MASSWTFWRRRSTSSPLVFEAASDADGEDARLPASAQTVFARRSMPSTRVMPWNWSSRRQPGHVIYEAPRPAPATLRRTLARTGRRMSDGMLRFGRAALVVSSREQRQIRWAPE